MLTKETQKSAVLEESEIYCQNFAFQMSALEDSKSRAELKRRMEKVIYDIKYHNSY